MSTRRFEARRASRMCDSPRLHRMGLASPIRSLWLASPRHESGYSRLASTHRVGSPDLRYVEIALSHAKNSSFHVTNHQLHSLREKRFTTRATSCFHLTNLIRLKRDLVAHGVVFHVTDSASLGSNSPRHERVDRSTRLASPRHVRSGSRLALPRLASTRRLAELARLVLISDYGNFI